MAKPNGIANAKPKKKKTKTEKPKRFSMTTVKTKYGFSDSMIAEFLPEPELVRNPHYSTAAPMRLWSESLVQTIAEKPEVKAELEKLRNRREKKKEKDADNRQKAIEALTKFGFDGMLEQARRFPRMFYIHCGPTNSGKTYQALEALKGAENGVYLGPLRLLACEVYDTLNDSGVPCRLLTGEEHIEVSNARITASTVEMADYSAHYDVAIIDEAQMISDKSRGGEWLKAILL